MHQRPWLIFATLRSGEELDTTDLWRAKNDAEIKANRAWSMYASLAQNGGSGPDRLDAVRKAIQADKELGYASQEWRRACGITW